MSITRNVFRGPWFRAPAALFGALALLGTSALATTGVAAAAGGPARPAVARPARAPVIDPLARIASLRALVAERDQAANAAQNRLAGTFAELGRAQLAENT